MSSDFAERFAALRRAGAAFDQLQNEILEEKASSLGHHGRLVAKAMEALKAYDAAGGMADGNRLKLVKAAAREVWAFFVLREACGLRDQKEIIKDYGIPPEVLVRLGAFERSSDVSS